MAEFTIERMTVPARIDDDDAADFVGMTEVRNACEVAGFGGSEFAHPAAEILPSWHDRHEPTIGFVAKIGGRVVARGVHETRLGDAASTAWLTVQVHPDFRRRGIGRALADRVEELAREQGQSTLIVYAVSPDGPGERLVPSTGAGSVPVHNREVQFLLARGYALGQVNRASRLTLPVDPALLDAVVASTEVAASADYRILCWVGPTPEPYKAGIRMLRSRMTTDAPLGDLDEPAEEWSVERLDDYDREIEEGPRFMVTAAAEHVPSGDLAGFTQLLVSADTSRPVDQEDTIVLKEHRGRRLGILLKVANIRQLEGVAPGHPSIITFNAEENRPMLKVNEAVGFVPVGYEAAWQKRAEPRLRRSSSAEPPAPQVE